MKQDFEILNRAGLHARAAAVLVQCASAYSSHVTISKDGESVNGKSIMGVMMLAATQGSTITIEIEGDDAEDAMKGLAELINRKFDEE